jgi:GT2 family glycosyltransferase
MTLQLPRSPAPRVSIIIPATAAPDLLHACLRSIARSGPSAIRYETIVVLNEAWDEDAVRLTKAVTGAQVISSPFNLGLSGAGNRGRDVARGEFLLLLHDDAEVEPGWMEALVATADSHPEAGAIGGKVLHPDGRLQNAGMILWRDGSTSPPWVGELPGPDAFGEVRAVDYCGTSSLLVRAAAWDLVGGLDERFYPVYFVDVDLAMALRAHGFVVLYQPASRIRHHQGASGTLRFRAFVSEHNRLQFLEKWGAALDAHEPRDRNLRVAIERAIARADAFGRAQIGGPRTAVGSAVAQRPPFDPNLQERRLAEWSRTIQNAYVDHLSRLLAECEAERARAEVGSRADGADTYQLEAPLRFCRGGSAYGYGPTGLHPPEDWGAWMGRDPFRIALTLGGGSVALVLVLEALHLLDGERRRSRIRIIVNGVLVLEEEETRFGPQIYAMALPERAQDAADRLDVQIETDDAMSPAGMGLSTDERLLSIGLIALTVHDAVRLKAIRVWADPPARAGDGLPQG